MKEHRAVPAPEQKDTTLLKEENIHSMKANGGERRDDGIGRKNLRKFTKPGHRWKNRISAGKRRREKPARDREANRLEDGDRKSILPKGGNGGEGI